MGSRAMVVVAGGSSTRFGGDKLLEEIAGKPLISHTIEAVSDGADIVVVAVRPDLIGFVSDLGHDVVVTTGGATRTDSEHAGLAELDRDYDLVGIHDGARPLITSAMIEELYEKAGEIGGAVPVLAPKSLLIDRRTITPLRGAVRVQTPQVFSGPELLAAYMRATQTNVVAHDSVDVVQRFANLEIAMVPGDPVNIKVTYPEDLETVRIALEDRSRT